MQTNFRTTILFACAYIASLLLIHSSGFAQESRITGEVDPAQTVTLHGNVSPKAQPQHDLGPVDPGFKLSYVTLAFKPSTTQQAELDQLLANQQDRSSPNYHSWLTPEQYADRFGLSTADVARVRAWLESQGFTINYVARGRNWLAFTGTAAQIAATFHTEIHGFSVEGETHFANASDPSVPVTLAAVIRGFLGLDDFHRKPRGVHPKFNPPNGVPTPHALAPGDIATIYDLEPLYAEGIDGSGQKVAVVGASEVYAADLENFRSETGLPAPQVESVFYSTQPGITAAQGEADIDLEWVGAVAPNATIIFVQGADPLVASQYAIDQNYAPVLSTSFSDCEADASTLVPEITEASGQQANVQGITWLIASGDQASAACDRNLNTGTMPLMATHGLSVNYPATLPEVTAVGGTMFSEGSGTYWASQNAANGTSALSYIPEVAWNETAVDGYISGSTGGASTLFPKPAWQVGPGVPNDGARDVPDVALDAGAQHDPYLIFTNDGHISYEGGTSVATPVFAGMVVLLNQYVVSKGIQSTPGLGNINPNLYRLAQTNIFHDIVTGNNIVPCVDGTPDCTTESFGYYAGIGYDPVTGLGSVDAYNLVTEWSAPTPVSNVLPSCNPDPVYEQAPDANGFSWTFTLTLQETAGVGTSLTDFTVNGTSLASQITSFFGTQTIPAYGTISAALGYKTLTVPTTLVFVFSGVDAGGRQWSQQLSVPFNGMASSPPPAIALSKTQLQFSWTVGGAAPPSQSITVENSGGGTFTWTASSDVSWLSLSAATGVLTIGINPTGLAPGNYTGTVNVNAAGVPNSPQSITVDLTVNAASPTVVVSTVVNGASFQSAIVPGSWATIQGTNLSSTTGAWNVVNGTLPTTVNGVTVTVGKRPAYVNYVSPGQINFIVPEVPAGSQQVVVQNSIGTSAAFNVTVSNFGPAFFAWPSNQVVATRQDFTYAVANGTFAGTTTTPAKPGDVLILWGTGFGPTNPTAPEGEVTPSNATYSTATVPTVTIGGTSATVYGAALAPGFAGLYQIAIQVPTSLGNGNWPLVATIGGVSSPSGMVLAVQ